ncbi:MAG: hypothetical protein A3F84_13410 [Candidatus Handelsmanbacteria bacterium RIFCSPLOWO2_12_FULL_64_10]|uniref:DUF4325 domain-containing protein n=1 Tax=Handelsmanbacteria sp. (strain RIFCSPLOWO2_12_FULL_64_10) TaxID=1817868 RepID=A0A1F6C421_HANXR|nr:MAG: hypothetical protein A3F84_13410 [Candidatus Handelsmanbacteria bacterium RIFCSPLOWO2_12_FULL_64_10]
MLHKSSPFILTAPNGILTGRDKGEKVLNQAMDHLRAIEFETVVPLDFGQVEFIDISCADEFLARLLMRIGSGELGTRFVFIQGVNPSVRETVEAVLRLRGLTALLKEDHRVVVVGDLKRPMRETLDVLIQKKQVTSSDVATALDKNVNIVCNRLNALQRLGLICRVRDGSVPGGGRQYYYESIV